MKKSPAKSPSSTPSSKGQTKKAKDLTKSDGGRRGSAEKSTTAKSGSSEKAKTAASTATKAKSNSKVDLNDITVKVKDASIADATAH